MAIEKMKRKRNDNYLEVVTCQEELQPSTINENNSPIRKRLNNTIDDGRMRPLSVLVCNEVINNSARSSSFRIKNDDDKT